MYTPSLSLSRQVSNVYTSFVKEINALPSFLHNNDSPICLLLRIKLLAVPFWIVTLFCLNPLLLIRNGMGTSLRSKGGRQESRCLKKRNRLDHEKGILDEELSQINA